MCVAMAAIVWHRRIYKSIRALRNRRYEFLAVLTRENPYPGGLTGTV